MSDNNEQIDETVDEAELLLPWYVSGKISDEDRAKVELWLERHPGAQAHLARTSEELDLTFADSENLGRPSRASFDKLMAEVGPGKQTMATGSGFVERIWGMLSPRYALAGAAALCLVVLGQAAVLTNMSLERPGEFAVATSENAVVSELTALVRFSPESTLDAVTELLADLDLRISDGPKTGGLFIIAAADSKEGAEALETLAGNTGLVTYFATQE